MSDPTAAPPRGSVDQPGKPIDPGAHQRDLPRSLLAAIALLVAAWALWKLFH